MSSEITIEDKRSAAIERVEVQPPASLMTVIGNLAANPNVDVDKIQKLLEIQERWEMNRAKAEFREAMATFKQNPPKIVKDRVAQIKARESGNVVGSYNFADLEMVSSAIIEGLAAVGITHHFPMKQEGLQITVTCVLSKGMYSEDGSSLTAPSDTTGAKNAIQAIASTVSYLQKYTLLGATGMAAGMPDTDGNVTPAAVQIMPAQELQDWLDAIDGAPDDPILSAHLKKARAAAEGYKCDVSNFALDKAALKNIQAEKWLTKFFKVRAQIWEAAGNHQAVKELGDIYDKRKAEIGGQE